MALNSNRGEYIMLILGIIVFLAIIEVEMSILQQLLCPPGAGVFTVNTARDKKYQLWDRLYGTHDVAEVEQQWQQQLAQISVDRTLLLGVCSDTGGGIQRGANWGPMFVRSALLNHSVENVLDIGDVRVIPHLLHDKYLNDVTVANCRKALYHDSESHLPVSPLSMTETAVKAVYQQVPAAKIFAIGGDHSVSYPLVKGFLQQQKALGKRAALIHFDAHTDLLVERLGIDLCFGSWTTHVLPYLVEPQDCIQIGIRATGHSKAHWQDTFGVQQFWADAVLKEGATAIAEQILVYLQSQPIDTLYITFDIDAIDAAYVSATGTPEVDGLTPAMAMEIIQRLAAVYPVDGADVVEVAPFVQQHGVKAQHEPDSTLAVAGDIAYTLLQAMQTKASYDS